MRLLASGLMLLVGSGCSWPPFPGNLDGSNGGYNIACGLNWTDPTNGALSINNILNSIFVNNDAVYAVGENGIVLVLHKSSPIPTMCRISNNPSLRSIWITVGHAYIAGSNGIYETDPNKICASPPSPLPGTSTYSCSDIWGIGTVGFAACDTDILKTTDAINWISDYKSGKPKGQGASTIAFESNANKAVVGASYGVAFANYDTRMSLATWSQTSGAPNAPTIWDSWIDSDQFVYLLGDRGAIGRASLNDSPLSWVPIMLLAMPTTWNLKSMWGISETSRKTLYVAGYDGPDPSKGRVWTFDPQNLPPPVPPSEDVAANIQGIQGDDRNLFIVGSTGTGSSTKGMILCRQRK